MAEGITERHESFADALRTAIHDSGLGLDRIRARLRTHGLVISSATLSYWQSGRSRPERRDSLRALAYLEHELQLPPNALTSLLSPPRARGRWPARGTASDDLATWWPDPAAVQDAATGVDTRWDGQLTRLSQHDVVTIGPRREERAFESRQVLRAEVSGPDRWIVIVHLDEHHRPLPTLVPIRNCRLGRVVTRPQAGLLVAELLFERPLSSGETIVIEYSLVNREPCPHATNYERKFRLPVRSYVLEICFHAETQPRQCEQFTRLDGQSEQIRQTPLDETHTVHGVALNFGPGCYGFRWDWATADTLATAGALAKV